MSRVFYLFGYFCTCTPELGNILVRNIGVQLHVERTPNQETK